MMALLVLAAPPADELREAQRRAFAAALETIRPSIVRIDTIGGATPLQNIAAQDGSQRTFAGFRQADGPTTGVVWSASGDIVTSSFNFLREPSIITVTLHDGRRLVARLVARDRVTRLALLKLDASDLPAPALLAGSDVSVGMWAMTAGFGFGGARPTLAVGTVSGLGRMGGLAIQTDAKISPANYGGPLFDVEGRLMGVCAPLGPGEDEFAGLEWYDSGIGFAISTDVVRRRVERLQAGADLRRGLLGLLFDLRDPVVGAGAAATSQSQPAAPAGIRVEEAPPGPAAEAGIREGDILTHLDETPLTRPVDLRRALAARAAGDEVTLKIWREGETIEARLRLVSEDELAAASSQPAP